MIAMRTYIDVSAYWPKDSDGNPKSVNSVWEDAKKNGFKIGRNTLTNAIGGKLDRVHLVNFRKLVALCAFWSGKEVTPFEIMRDEDD